jgi:cation diffusion facilitator family transporter
LLLNLVLVGVLVLTGLLAHSLGVLAAGGDYIADAAAIGVSLFAIWLARRPPAPARPGGHPNATNIAALVNGGWLLALSILVVLAAIRRLVSGAPQVDGLPVLIVSAVAAAVMLAGALILAGDPGGDDGDSGEEGDLNMKAVLLDTAADAAAAGGVAISGAVILATGSLYWLDPAVALIIAVVVGYHALSLVRKVIGAIKSSRPAVTTVDDAARKALLRRGFALEYATLGWNVAGIVVLAIAAISARSVALAGFGLDSLIEIGASAVVIWELSGTGEARQRRALRLIGAGFALLAVYLLVQSTVVLVTGFRPHHSPLGIGWTAVTVAVMLALAGGKAATGAGLGNPVLTAEGRVTLIDGLLSAAVLAGLVLNTALGWWQADPAAGYVLMYYAAREVREIFAGGH